MADIFLSLRDHRHQLKAVKRPDGPGTMLARFYPSQEYPRANAVEQWGLQARSERQVNDVTVNIPIPVREQTTITARMPRGMNRLLAGNALLPPVQSRRSMTPARAPRVPSHLDQSIAPLSICPARRCQHGGFAVDVDGRRGRYGR